MDSAEERSAAKAATAARIYDYLLGGVHNFPADREVAQEVVAQMPYVRAAARANRAFLGRVVRHLAAQGIDQFIDIGSGIPTVGNVHEIAHRVRPDARVAYADIDPLAVAESLDLLNGDERATAVCGDLRDPQRILAHPELNRLLDLDQPVGLLLIAVLHFVADDAQAYEAVEQFRQALAPGSFLAVSHGATEGAPKDSRMSLGRAYGQLTSTGSAKPRNRAEFARFFTGWDLVDPGVVWLSEWRPDPHEGEFADDPTKSVGWAGVGRRV
jgi:S-adenosyl methyltransferase